MIELLALTISIVNLFLYYKAMRKEKIKLKIEQVNNESFSFKLVWYAEYECLFFRINVENNSKTETSISKIYITDEKGNKYTPCEYSLGDTQNENGLTLFQRDDTSFYSEYNLSSENFLNNLRIPSFGNLNGYLVFLDFPVITEKKEVILYLHTPDKCFKKKILIYPLPSHLKPYYE